MSSIFFAVEDYLWRGHLQQNLSFWAAEMKILQFLTLKFFFNAACFISRPNSNLQKK